MVALGRLLRAGQNWWAPALGAGGPQAWAECAPMRMAKYRRPGAAILLRRVQRGQRKRRVQRKLLWFSPGSLSRDLFAFERPGEDPTRRVRLQRERRGQRDQRKLRERRKQPVGWSPSAVCFVRDKIGGPRHLEQGDRKPGQSARRCGWRNTDGRGRPSYSEECKGDKESEGSKENCSDFRLTL